MNKNFKLTIEYDGSNYQGWQRQPNMPTIQEYIIDPDKTLMIRQAIQEGHSQYGMQTFDQSLMKLYRDGLISYEDALANSTSPDEFCLRVKGIEASSDTTWGEFEQSTQDSLSG